jgi:hypothetical protein
MLGPLLIEKPNFLNGSNISNKNFMIFGRKLMQSQNNDMINIDFHTSFRWEIRYSCNCRKSVSYEPIKSFAHFDRALQHHQGYE